VTRPFAFLRGIALASAFAAAVRTRRMRDAHWHTCHSLAFISPHRNAINPSSPPLVFCCSQHRPQHPPTTCAAVIRRLEGQERVVSAIMAMLPPISAAHGGVVSKVGAHQAPLHGQPFCAHRRHPVTDAMRGSLAYIVHPGSLTYLAHPGSFTSPTLNHFLNCPP
jgi:hypothetical protein